MAIMSGKVLAVGKFLANLDDVFIREGVAGGSVIAHIDRDLVRAGISGGNVLLLIDSNVTDMGKCALAVAVFMLSD